MYYLEKNSKILNNGLKFLKYGSISDFFSRLLRLDNPNLLDDYEKPIPLFLVNI